MITSVLAAHWLTDKREFAWNPQYLVYYPTGGAEHLYKPYFDLCQKLKNDLLDGGFWDRLARGVLLARVTNLNSL